MDEATGDADEFQFGLSFAGQPCPSCGTVAQAGPCASCGEAVPALDGLGEAAAARRQALLPLRDAAEAALAAFDDLPNPEIPIARAVMLSGLAEARLFSRILDVFSLGRTLAELDLDDPEVVRGSLVAAVRERLAVVEAMLALCQDISRFRAGPPADRLPGVAAALGRQAARILVAFLAALTAVDLDAARDAERALQAELNGVAGAEQLDEILEQLSDMPAGTDQRVAAALAREGTFTDAYGTIDLARVLWAYRASADPFLAVGRRAARYFEPLLSVELDVDELPHAVMLAVPLLEVVAMDHPLVAHRLVRETHDLFRQALAVDREAVDTLRRRLVTGGDALLAAHERGRAAALELSASGGAPDDVLLDGLLGLYRNAAGELWQPFAELLDDLAAVAGVHDADAPRTLRGARELLLLEPSTAFAWAQVDGDVHVLHQATGRTWDLDDFGSELDRLLSAVAGADAGWCLGMVTEDLLGDDEPVGRAGAAVLVRALVGPAGATVVDVAEDGSVITVASLADELDVQRLLSATAGLAAAFPVTEHFSIRDEAGAAIIEMPAATMRAAQEAPPVLRDLAVVAAAHDSRIARGEPVADVTRHLTAVQAHITAMSALQDLADPYLQAFAHRELVERLGYVAGYARRNGQRKLAQRLGRARASAAMAARGDRPAHLRTVDQLTALASWARGAGAALRWV